MQNLTREQLKKISEEVQVILDKYNVTLQIVQGISYVQLPPKEVAKEAEIVSPYIPNEPNTTT